jgi:integrase
MRQPEPRWRDSRKTWVCRYEGKWITLAHGKENKQKAWKVLRAILNENTEKKIDRPETITFWKLFELYFEWVSSNRETKTIQSVEFLVKPFAEFTRGKPASEIAPHDIQRWFKVGKSKLGPGTKARAIETISSVYNWGIKSRIVRENPIKNMPKPTKPKRERIITDKEREKLHSLIKDESFKNLFIAMEETGARPEEVVELEAKDIHWGRGIWIIQNHKTKSKTGKPRIIYMTERLKSICEKLSKENPKGPIFLNTRGKPWGINAWRQRFKRIRQKHPEFKDVVLYTLRHSYATDALTRGVDIATLAELMGHSSTRMIEQNYGHLDQKSEYLRKMAEKARGGGG